MDSEVSQVIQTYKDLACNPTPISAKLVVSPDKSLIHVFSCWTIPDLVRSECTTFTRDILLQHKSEKFTVLSQGHPSDVSSASHCAYSKSGKKCALLRKVKKNEESIFLEIWNSSQKECTFDMSERKEHGKIHDSGEFKAFEWSANDEYLLYIAEMKQKKSESFFKDIFHHKTDKKEGEEPPSKGEENLYQESWGECHTSAYHTVLCIFEVKTGKVEVVNLDEKFPNTSAAEATWGPNDEYIVFVGFKETPYHQGLVYCSNRSSSLFSYSVVTKDIERLTSDENVCVEYPVFSPNLETFVFLQNKSGGPHKSCRKLMRCDWKRKEILTVVDLVNEPKGDEFCGLYTMKLSSQWWSKDSRFFFFHTYQRSYLEIFCIDMVSRKIQKIETDKSHGSCVLFDVKDPYIIISVSSPNLLPFLMIGYFCTIDDKIRVRWSSVEDNSHCILSDLSWSVHLLSPACPNKAYPTLDYDIIVLSSEIKNGSLIIMPHGGPHSVFPADFYLSLAALSRLGYIICLVNYRGSIGFGENSIKSLLGNIGTQDVSDVVNAVEYLRKDEKLGIKHIFGNGGSHGGFLVAHLLGQHPELLKAAVIRNPVIDLGSMAETSDIPDWCWIESGCSEVFAPSETVNPSILKEMWEKSPIKYIKKVRSPVLLCLGKNDLRVPPSQGLLFYKHLKAQNVPTKVFYYDDNHALSKVGVSSDVFVHMASWFQTHLSS